MKVKFLPKRWRITLFEIACSLCGVFFLFMIVGLTIFYVFTNRPIDDYANKIWVYLVGYAASLGLIWHNREMRDERERNSK